MGLGFNFFCLTWSPLTTVAIFQTTKNSLGCHLNYFHPNLNVRFQGENNTVVDVISEWGLNLISCSKPFTNFKDGLNFTEKRVSLLVVAVISFKS